MNENTWGFQFTKVDTEKDEFQILLGLNIGDEGKTKKLFDAIKEEFEENQNEPDCILDLLDNEDSIISDFALTKKQAIEIAERLGHKIG